ncbi:MAG: oligosaccharide flippase family protein [Lachnospiraceae bacterium]|nr:oligosaccharide flippase family protein [Lachnospiraceae bacterium]
MTLKIVTKYEKLPVMIKASFWFTVCSVVQKGISLLTTPIFTRVLSASQYGEYTVFQTWYSIISIFATLNLYYSTTYNGLTKFKNKKQFISSMQGLCTIITLTLFLIYILFQDIWNNIFLMKNSYIYAMFLELLFVPAYNFWMAKERYDFKYKKIIAVTIIIAFVSPILAILLILNTNAKAEARIFSYVFVQVIVGLILYIYNLKDGKLFYNNKFWKYGLTLNIPLIPHYLSSVILNDSDRLMINSMCGKSQAAIYSVSYSIAMMMTILVTAINNSLTPYIYKSLKEKNYNGIKKNVNLLIAFISIMCLLAITYGPELISIFASKEYYDSIWVIPPVACSVYFCFLYPLFSTIEFYYEKTKYVMIASMIGAILNLLLNYYFIPHIGYYAAGYTTLFCYILYSFSHYFFSTKILHSKGIRNLFDIKFISFVSILVVFMMAIITLLYTNFLLRMVFGIVEVLAIIMLCKKYRLLHID